MNELTDTEVARMLRDNPTDTPMDGLKRCVSALCLIRDASSLVGCYPHICDESTNNLCVIHGIGRLAYTTLISVGVEEDE